MLGIIGCICFGIGDWLLGYVDPGVIGERISEIKWVLAAMTLILGERLTPLYFAAFTVMLAGTVLVVKDTLIKKT